jgi:hypothetical protein
MAGYNDFDPGIPEFAKEYVDGRVQGTVQSTLRGTLEVLGSGFGKGLLITAGIITAGILVTSILFPAALSIPAGATVAKAVETGALIAGNYLLGNAGGWLALAAGGAVGSMVEARAENNRISKESAECQAALYAKLREDSPAKEKQQDMTVDAPANEMCGGHCARLMQEQQRGNERGIA